MPILIFPSLQFLARSRVTPSGLTWSRSTVGNRVNELGQIEQVSANAVRHDFEPLTGIYRGFLIEEGRTNLLLRSAELDNASWANVAATRTANSIAAPDGTVTADKLASDGTSGEHGVRQEGIAGTPTNKHSLSFWAKAAEFSRVMARISSPTGSCEVFFNLNGSGSVTTATNNGGAVQTAGVIEPYPNGWFRCVVIGIPGNAAGTIGAHIEIVNDSGAANFSGSSGSGVQFWGAQLEAGANPTSYIATTSAQVTRAADIPTIATSAFKFNADEGTLLVEAASIGTPTGSEFIVSIDAGSTNDYLALAGPVNPAAQVNLATVLQANIGTSGSMANATFRKVAMAYKANDIRACNGGTLGTADTSATLPSGLTTLRLGQHAFGAQLNGWIRHFAYFPRALVNADLQEITQ